MRLGVAITCATLLLAGLASGDKGGGGGAIISSASGGAAYGAPIAPSYGAPQTPQIKYGGPIVYSGEKPPIIHFPPPPAQVKTNKILV